MNLHLNPPKIIHHELCSVLLPPFSRKIRLSKIVALSSIKSSCASFSNWYIIFQKVFLTHEKRDYGSKDFFKENAATANRFRTEFRTQVAFVSLNIQSYLCNLHKYRLGSLRKISYWGCSHRTKPYVQKINSNCSPIYNTNI